MSHLALGCDLDKKSKNYIHKIDKSAKSLLNIINDILDFSKMEAGKLVIEKVAFDLNDVIENILSLVEIKIDEKKLKLIVNNDNNKNTLYFGDPYRLTQIIMNLMTNAIKFTESGSVILQITNKSNNIVEFSIEDTGIGLSTNQIDKLFKSFSQGDTSTTRKYGGTGLGLSISKQLVELLDGQIWVESTEGVGSKFSFEIVLPQNHDSLENEKEKKIENFEQVKEFFVDLKNKKILLVEDNYINQVIVKGLLESSGILIDTVQNGKDAVEKMQLCSDEYNLILMDMKMPIMGGIEASKKIREINTTIPIIALTANALDTDKELARNAGMNDYLHKPIDIEKLYRILYKYLVKSDDIKKVNSKINSDIDCNILNKFIYLDFKSALKRLNGNEKLYFKILKDFKTNYQDMDFESFNKEDFKLTIHTLKGLAGNIGAQKLYEIAKTIECNNDKSTINILYQGLNEVLDDLSHLTDQKSEKVLKELIPDLIKKKLFGELKDSLKIKRPKQIMAVITKLNLYELKDTDTEQLNNIKEHIGKYRYKEALDLF